MKKKGNIQQHITDIINDPERSFSERVFVMLTIISVLVMLIALLGDIIFGENPVEIILLGVTSVAVPLITFISIRFNKLKIAIRVIVACLVFIILPIIFFFGGGVEGGGVFWFIFAFLYLGLVLSGFWRNLLLIVIVLLSGLFYYIEYTFPDLIERHDRTLFYTDSYISLILVGFVCVIMVNFQNRLFREENKKAKKETERAEELNVSQNRFFSSMSHEIRTPINSILGLNELILREPDASEEVTKDALGIQGAGKMLLALINDILDFSKIKAGGMDIIPVDYQVGNMMSEIVNMLWLRAQDKGLKFNVSIDPAVPSILYGDEVRIKQILINLLNNAVKYTAEGSIGLHIESDIIDENTVSLRISVSDTGMGIKKDSIPHLFDMFRRVDEDKNRHIEGTGLGLSIVKQLVDMMEGSITVDSVYGEGSTFTVTIKQGISDLTGVGELDIKNFGVAKSKSYESNFTAPSARILIVDDNEMNLEVEKKLLVDTKMQIDTAMSGREALNHTVKYRYDVILMDHLMPEMDGIECLRKIREQVGGLNRDIPIVVLTANVGSDSRELYRKAGFDGYLVKPVSGEALENMLIRHIPKYKTSHRAQILRMGEGIKTASGYVRKVPVIISTNSLADIPERVVRKLGIVIIPTPIMTEEGVFKDGSQIVADELIRYIRNGGSAISTINDVPFYTEVFAEALKHAHHLIHISPSVSMAQDLHRATEAAEAFDNVSVISSGCMSSGTGILVLIASRLVMQGISAEEIIRELEVVKHRIQCSFVLKGTEYMTRNRIISKRANNIVTSLQLHPSLKVRDDKTLLGGFWLGNMKRAYRGYIRKAFPGDVVPDTDIVFITYVDVPEETLIWFRDEVLKHASFEKVVFKQASAAISSNCGPGTIGVLYYAKGEKSYNIRAFLNSGNNQVSEGNEEPDKFKDKDEAETRNMLKEEGSALDDTQTVSMAAGEIVDDTHSVSMAAGEVADDILRGSFGHDAIEGIDSELAIKNSGSEEAFHTVLEIFYKAIDMKAEELKDLFEKEDWENYTIKVHALKSSSRLIGATGLASEAEALELAGKDKDIGYIRANHGQMLSDLIKYKYILSKIFEENDVKASEEITAETEGEESPEITSVMFSDQDNEEEFDEFVIESVFDSLKEGIADNDTGMINGIFAEMEEYPLPPKYRKIMTDMKACFDRNDLAGITDIIEGNKK